MLKHSKVVPMWKFDYSIAYREMLFLKLTRMRM